MTYHLCRKGLMFLLESDVTNSRYEQLILTWPRPPWYPVNHSCGLSERKVRAPDVLGCVLGTA